MNRTCVQNVQNVQGYKVLVTRYFPRGHRKEDFDMWCKSLAPSEKLLHDYHWNGISQEEFIKRYDKELFSNQNNIELMKQLAEMDTKTPVWLVCFEKDGEFCHTYRLMYWINAIKRLYPTEPICPNFIKGALENCRMKSSTKTFVKLPAHSRRSSSHNIIFSQRYPGIPGSCDFHFRYGKEPRGNLIKDCVLVRMNPGWFACRTCLFNYYGICLKTRRYIANRERTLGCDKYVERELRMGDVSTILKLKLLLEKGWTINKLRETWAQLRGLGERKISLEEIKEEVKNNPNVVLPTYIDEKEEKE